MNHLNYRWKFMLICSVFAIPLTFFAVQLATSYHQQAEQAQVTRDGLRYIQKTSLLIQELESLRDLNVITSWRAYPAFSDRYNVSKANTLELIKLLLRDTFDHNNQTFLNKLQKTIETDDLANGTLSASIDAVYEDAQIALDEVYNWRAKLSYSFVSFSRNNSHILSIINLLNETNNFTHTLGEARSYGSLYLAQQFVDSNGVQVLEKTYQKLSQLINLIELKDSEYRPFFIAYSQASLTNIKQSLLEGRELFYQQLIVDSAPTSNPTLFFDSLSLSFQEVYAYNQALFELSSNIVEEDYQKSIKQLSMFYLSVLCISLLLIYLAVGIYYSISVTIKELLKSAAFFAAGKYDKPVQIISHDELSAVANAMNNMRINVKEREETLALISQTDGLTQLYNRKFFDKALQVGLANTRRNMTPLTLVMMDIDFFKKINDEYGHLAGDKCLIKIAKLMQTQFKRQTDVVARYGGEEFIAILYGQDLEEAKFQTEKLRSVIENTTIISSERSFSVSASFGLACLIPPEDADAQDLIALADALLYQSKDKGRNRISAEHYSKLKGS
ncbi:MAG: diguanylate cyclase (GGDEF)-like protein [Oleiphilaceae bacterium]|jgi:diguanylate cyclase (GGDEF)-like protein